MKPRPASEGGSPSVKRRVTLRRIPRPTFDSIAFELAVVMLVLFVLYLVALHG
jgi:hypothetical protein